MSGRAVIDLNNIVCFDLHGTEWHDVLINHLRSDDFFEVERFPEALVVFNGARRIEDASFGRPNQPSTIVTELYAQHFAPFFGSAPPPHVPYIYDTIALGCLVNPSFASDLARH
jgi:hypothetical protein